jgi:hypothetical protein
MKKIIILLVIIFPLIVKSQSKDTIYISKVQYVSTLIDPVTNRVKKYWIKSKKVKSGYIIKVENNWYKVNNKILQVCNIDSLKNTKHGSYK